MPALCSCIHQVKKVRQVVLQAMATRGELEKLNYEELTEFLSGRIEEDISEDSVVALKDNRVNGRTFLELTDEDLRDIIKPLGDRKTLRRLIDSYKPAVS